MVERKRILVVDDDERVRFVLSEALRAHAGAYDVDAVSNGDEAVKLVEERGFDLVITDIRMPGLDGIRLTEMIRRLSGKVNVIWMTAYGAADLRSDVQRLHVRDCVEKPIKIGEIREVVRSVLGE